MAASFSGRLNNSSIVSADPDTLRQLNGAFPDRYPFLLQSTSPTGALGRFDILFAAPGESLTLESSDELKGRAASGTANFLDALDTWFSTERKSTIDAALPFSGGWFLYLGYELAAQIEPSLQLQRDTLLPVAFAVRCRAALIYDHTTTECYWISETASQMARKKLALDLAELQLTRTQRRPVLLGISEDNGDRFTRAVADAKKYIRAGDVYQANLSRLWRAKCCPGIGAEDVYAALCRSNPAPFAGIAYWQGSRIISSSPERLVRVENGWISTRPIAGTRPRGVDDDSDDVLSDELFTNEKERAEHIMLIDLERNDLGRVADAGTVEVDEMMILESYAHVHHIVSNIRGRLRNGVSPGEVIAAVFPGGTITGCPKVRCMEIIDELEDSPRGAYTGSFGYLNLDGNMDLNILIRTMVMRGDELQFRAGSGIVADSDPCAELEETRAKAEGMLRALSND